MKGSAQIAKGPQKVEHLRTITAGLDPDRALDVRDRVLILIGFAGAFRRSELVGYPGAPLQVPAALHFGHSFREYSKGQVSIAQ